MKTGEFFVRELRARAGTLVVFAGCTGLFALLGVLTGMPPVILAYGVGLCVLFTFLVLAAQAARSYSRCRQMERLTGNLPASLDELPPPVGAQQAQYAALLDALARRCGDLEASAKAERGRMTDYYTLWAHQIKTPIAAMHLLLQSGKEPPVQELEAELFKVEQYVELVLQYLRSEELSADLCLGRVPLDGLVKTVVRKYAKLFILKKIRLEYQDLPGQALTDEKWLGFVLEQLLSNALKYTPAGGQVTIGLVPGQKQTLFIRDSGIGIAPEDLPRIMERGFTGYNGRENKKSTGLGLYLCRKVLAQLGHPFWLESAPGKGTTAFIDLYTRPVGVE